MNDKMNFSINVGNGLEHVGYTEEPIVIDQTEKDYVCSDYVPIEMQAIKCSFKIKGGLKIMKQLKHREKMLKEKEIIRRIEFILQNTVQPPVYGRIKRYRMKQLGVYIVVDHNKEFYGILYKGSVYQFDESKYNELNK